MGVTISMDDFGTGYSSLSHLAKLPVSELKIDRSFMADLEESEAVQALVTAVIRIGETLKLRVVAEGVETRRAAAVPRGAGVRRAAGLSLRRSHATRMSFEEWLAIIMSSSLAPAARLRAS